MYQDVFPRGGDAERGGQLPTPRKVWRPKLVFRSEHVTVGGMIARRQIL